MEKQLNAGQQPEGQERKRVSVSRRSYLAIFFVAVMLLFALVCKVDEVLHPEKVEQAEAAYRQMLRSFQDELSFPADTFYENPEVDTLKMKEEMQAGGKRPESN